MSESLSSQKSANNLNSEDDGLITSFEGMKNYLHEMQTPAHISITHENSDAIHLRCEGVDKILINANIYRNSAVLKNFVDLSQRDNIYLICVGNTIELSNIADHDSSHHLHQLGIPVTKKHFFEYFNGLHKLQLVLHQTNIEKERISQASEEVKYVLSISRELNGERDIPKLLNLILFKAREVTRADAGSIYTLHKGENQDISQGILRFRFTQNDSISQDFSEFEMAVNDKSVVGCAVVYGQSINIADLYLLDSDPQKNHFGVTHDRSWDKRSGYESHSMLTIPMYDISHSIIGVIQLINCKKDKQKILKSIEDFQGNVEPFNAQLIEYAEIVAQQAGIALENAKMQDEIQKLFDSFVHTAVTAIELRDPTTSGHSHRVATLTINLAENLNRVQTGIFKDIVFNQDQMREIKYASLLHDFGKLGVRENVLVKAKKLYPDEFRLIKERFRLIHASLENEYLNKLVDFLKNPQKYPIGVNEEQLLVEKNKKIKELDRFYSFICKANEPTVLEQGGFELLRDIANCSFSDHQEKARPYLSDRELRALSVSRGSLTAEEFAQIQSHVLHTYEFLRKIPWGPKLMNVPQIAAKHHEKLDGSGYPTSAAAEDIPLQSRMMTIADMYDALTASDRPYKKAVPIEKALDIIHMDVKGGKIDKDLFALFLDSKAYLAVTPG